MASWDSMSKALRRIDTLEERVDELEERVKTLENLLLEQQSAFEERLSMLEAYVEPPWRVTGPVDIDLTPADWPSLTTAAAGSIARVRTNDDRVHDSVTSPDPGWSDYDLPAWAGGRAR